jgi:hypothetical protein
MESIGARVVNELFINHMFSLALSLHGGTESLTYPYGTPNHMKSKSVPKLPVSYENRAGKLSLRMSQDAMPLIEEIRSGKYEMKVGKSTNPPDINAIKSMAETASDHTTSNPSKKYKTGDMNGEVYSVTGGMEDWAYSGSWEGSPIITQPCEPTTYKGYSSEKTNYDKNHKDSLKSIMFLLEVSHQKVPEQKLLGRKNLDCLINLRSNAFFNHAAANKQICLDDYIDGYIPRIIRLSLTLIDLLHPYITFISQKEGNNYKVRWTVGGSITVDETFISYGYYNEKPNDQWLSNLSGLENFQDIKKQLTNQTSKKSGKGVWNIKYSTKNAFTEVFENPQSQGQFLVFIILAKVDKNWSLKNHPDPDVNPQTHIANFRTNAQYVASNAGFTIKGQEYFKSSIKVVNTSNLN